MAERLGSGLQIRLQRFNSASHLQSTPRCGAFWYNMDRMAEDAKDAPVKVPKLAMVLTAIGWFWTAYECDTIGIDVFDMLLKRFPGQLWIMAAVLTYLTIIWMPKNLLTRSIMGIFMLIPAELFKITRPMLPDGGFAPVQIVVAIAYVLAIIGMYGMFYPWRIEKALKWIRPCASLTSGKDSASPLDKQ